MKRGKRGKRKCLHCHDSFRPDPRVLNQRYCSKSSCQRESHRRSSRKHRAKVKRENPVKHLLEREQSKERVQEWRSRHPGYWRRKKDRKKLDESVALRDSIRAENGVKLDALRDLIIWQHYVVKGLAGHLTDALRDEMDIQLNHFHDRGVALSMEGNVNLKRGGNT